MLRALCRVSASELFRLGYEMGGGRPSANTATKPNAARASGTALLIAAAYAAATKLSRMTDSFCKGSRDRFIGCVFMEHIQGYCFEVVNSWFCNRLPTKNPKLSDASNTQTRAKILLGHWSGSHRWRARFRSAGRHRARDQRARVRLRKWRCRRLTIFATVCKRRRFMA